MPRPRRAQRPGGGDAAAERIRRRRVPQDVLHLDLPRVLPVVVEESVERAGRGEEKVRGGHRCETCLPRSSQRRGFRGDPSRGRSSGGAEASEGPLIAQGGLRTAREPWRRGRYCSFCCRCCGCCCCCCCGCC